jgi:ribosome-binding ATPase YchF (GTP1/OBG family)
VKANSFTEQEIAELKEDSLSSMNQCLAVIIESRDAIMDDHKWSRNKRVDDKLLDLYSSLRLVYKDLIKYKDRFLNNKKLNTILKNKESFTSEYLVCSAIIERMLQEAKQ